MSDRIQQDELDLIEPCDDNGFRRDRALWDQIIDQYIEFIGTTSATLHRLSGFNIIEPNAGVLFKTTLVAIGIVFVIVLSSCVSPMQRYEARPTPQFSSKGIAKQPEKIYLKRDDTKVRTREQGSHSGSIFADTKSPRQLFAEHRPGRVGDTIEVVIPDELQFHWDPLKSPSGKDKSSKTADKGKSAGKERESGSPELADFFQNTPSSMFSFDPVKNFRMEVVALEPTGDLYLRGVKNFDNNLGERRSLTILGKIPYRGVNGFEIDARALTAIQVIEDGSSASSDYTATGWDTVVSRKLSGFVPDIAAEMAAAEDVRKELAIQQQGLAERAKALGEERERLKKDRDRILARADANANSANGSEATAKPTAAAPAPAPSGGK